VYKRQFPGRVFAAKVDEVATLPEPTRRSTDTKVYEVRVALAVDNQNGAVRPGMNGSVEIDVGVLPDVLSVPVPAVKRRDEAHYVWLLEGDVPVARRVTLGRNNLTHVEVLQGLAVGDRIRLVPPPGRELPDPDSDGASAANAAEEVAEPSEAPGAPTGG